MKLAPKKQSFVYFFTSLTDVQKPVESEINWTSQAETLLQKFTVHIEPPAALGSTSHRASIFFAMWTCT